MVRPGWQEDARPVPYLETPGDIVSYTNSLHANSIRADEFSFVLAWIQVIVRFLNSS